MAEYIEREAALESVREKLMICDSLPDTIAKDASLFTLASMQDSLKSIPAANVRPVVLGKWSIHEIYKHEMSYGVTGYEPVYKCSVCGRLMESYLRFDEPIMPEDASFPRFCPNCGADMREES